MKDELAKIVEPLRYKKFVTKEEATILMLADSIRELTAQRDHYRDCISAREVRALVDRCEQFRIDAERYRWLREQHWDSSNLCIVMYPKNAVKLGHECPSGSRLDSIIDTALKKPHGRNSE